MERTRRRGNGEKDRRYLIILQIRIATMIYKSGNISIISSVNGEAIRLVLHVEIKEIGTLYRIVEETSVLCLLGGYYLPQVLADEHPFRNKFDSTHAPTFCTGLEHLTRD
jgi:hypothetical protein